MTYRILDLYCGAGGAGTGYARAGFEVVGVDINPQKNYPYEFRQGDALQLNIAHVRRNFDAIHASPPCQAYSAGTGKERSAGKEYPDLLPPTRVLLEQTGLPWVIENVVGAPMRGDLLLCGSMFGLPGLRRHRLFETSWHQFAMTQPCVHTDKTVTVVGHGPNSHSPFYLERRSRMNAGEDAEKWWFKTCCEAMGIDWMNRDELAEAIPPAYTEHIAHFLIQHLEYQAIA
jgi:hypothetical protein